MTKTDIDFDALVGAMTIDEKASLTAGVSLWYLPPVERLGIPALGASPRRSFGRARRQPDRASLALLAVRHDHRFDLEPGLDR